MGWTVWSSTPSRDKRFFSSRTSRLAPIQGAGGFTLGYGGWDIKLTTYLHLVPILQVSRAPNLRSLYAFMVMTGTLAFLLYHFWPLRYLKS